MIEREGVEEYSGQQTLSLSAYADKRGVWLRAQASTTVDSSKSPASVYIVCPPVWTVDLLYL